MTHDPTTVVERLSLFQGADLTRTLANIEDRIRGLEIASCSEFLSGVGAEREALAAAALLKRLAGQINVTIHALGILLCLPHILEPGERTEYVSLGAGNTGRAFDLETNLRIAEFKFAYWRGGAESIRQNGVFKDYFLLGDSGSPKRRYLYLLGVDQALRFLRGGRALSSVLSRDEKLRTRFRARHGEAYRTVGEYYADHREAVVIEDISHWLGELLDVEPAGGG